MDVLAKLRDLLDERGWSEYKLAKKAGLNESTIANIYRRNTVPTIATLEAICGAFGITMSEFFAGWFRDGRIDSTNERIAGCVDASE